MRTESKPPSGRAHPFHLFLLFGFGSAFLNAFLFIATLYYTLPPTDLAYGKGLFQTLGDPFVLSIAALIAFFAGLTASPLLYFCLRHRRLAVALPVVFGSVLLAVIGLTPVNPWLGLCGSFAALVASCTLCSRIRMTRQPV